jgi:hypothetical protein
MIDSDNETGQDKLTNNNNVDSKSENMFITNSKRISPAIELRKSLQNQKSIHLWRVSDIFYNEKEKSYTIHYQVSF